jgi:hypothetical protein
VAAPRARCTPRLRRHLPSFARNWPRPSAWSRSR